MYIRVFVTAQSRRDRLSRSPDGTFAVSVRAPAQGGRANQRVLELIAQEHDVAVTQVRIISGHHGRAKMISISN